MLLHQTAANQLLYTANLAQQLSAAQYTHTPEMLSGSSVGQHVRHLYGFFECLQKALVTGLVDYDARPRDPQMENDPLWAVRQLQKMADFLQEKEQTANQNLKIQITYRSEKMVIDTSFERELYHNIEHTVHHLAIIKMAVVALWPEIQLPVGFGIADSTLRYQQHHAKAALVD